MKFIKIFSDKDEPKDPPDNVIPFKKPDKTKQRKCHLKQLVKCLKKKQ